MTIRIGITGPIACGKSTLAGWLRDLGARVIDADAVARMVVGPGMPALAAVFGAFGDRVRAADGSLDRAALGSLVFTDPAALARLEAIVHPAVRSVILDAIGAAEESGHPAIVIEAIKLVEGGLASVCDEVWLVTCSPHEQRARLRSRGTSAADAGARLMSQGAIRERLEGAATRVIVTSGTASDARVRAEAAYAAALAASHGRAAGEHRAP